MSRTWTSPSARALSVAAFGLLGWGCTGQLLPATGTFANGGAAGAVGAGGTGGAGPGGPRAGTGGGPPSMASCVGTDATAAKRVVRLSFNQLANSIGTLINTSLTQKLVDANDILDREHRAFPPLQSPREGNAVTDATWNTVDGMAFEASRYVADNLAAVTGCGASPTDACAQQYLTSLAQRAYRRPLTTDEKTRVTSLYTTALKGEAAATVAEAVQYGVYAILQAPAFMYRTEVGTDWKQAGPLTGYEVASGLSYFLTDDLPDATLLEAAAQGRLSTPAEIGVQVDRLLQTDATRKNLHGAMMSYFSYPQLETVKIDDQAFTDGVRNSMYHEAELFLQNTLWTGKVTDILLSDKTVVNAGLAAIYGISQFPPAGVKADADGFAPVSLPSQRLGILTQAGFLTTRSRPDKTSVVGRGLLVKNALLCTDTPPPPDAIVDQIAAVTDANPDASERELAQIRGQMSPCNLCHLTFDAYGLALDTFDVIGRHRSVDSKNRPIDTTVTLPDQIGGGTAKDALEVAQQIAASGAFTKCMGRNLINYALADVSAGAAEITSCAAARVAETFATTDQSFSSLVKSVATSAAFSYRLPGAVQ
jgi:hypothetical protein